MKLLVAIPLVLFVTLSCAEANNSVSGIPLGILYDVNVPSNIRGYASVAIKHINIEMKAFKMRWAFESVQARVFDARELISEICSQMYRGVLVIFGSTHTSSLNTLQTITNTHHLPFISWSSLPLTNQHVNSSRSFQLYMSPDLSPAIISLIQYYRWPKVYYIYNHEEAIGRVEAILSAQIRENDFSTQVVVRKVLNLLNVEDVLKGIAATFKTIPVTKNTKTQIVVMVDLDTRENYATFLRTAKDVGMMNSRNHYILVTLAMNEMEFKEYNGANITGFSMVDYYNPNTLKHLTDVLHIRGPLNKIDAIPYEAAMLIDALVLVNKKVGKLLGNNTDAVFSRKDVYMNNNRLRVNGSEDINCSQMRKNAVWPLGSFVLDKIMKLEDHEGLTGNINFDKNGKRSNYTIQIYRSGFNQPLSKIGTYSDKEAGLKLVEEQIFRGKGILSSLPNRKRIIVSIEDEPFFMVKKSKDGKVYTGNDRFEGYCVDLAQRIAEKLNITYEFTIVKDRMFGSINASGQWNGIVGELVRNEADLAIAPLSISSVREKVVDFSKSFMNIGISIMIKKPVKDKPSLLSFLEPLSTEIYLCIMLVFTNVSVILFMVSRFSPYEWRVEEKDGKPVLENDFTFFNTVWFCLAAFMGQGIDIAPKSVSGRLVTSVWWFFTLILISSYTANLAAFLTVERMVAPIESAEDLAKQTEIKYGAVLGGATQEFFRTNKVPTYSRMWSFMSSDAGNFVGDNFAGVQKVRNSKGKYAFLLESSVNEYLNERYPCNTMKVGSNLDSKGYGIATPINSDLRDGINLAVLQLAEEGILDEIKIKWWVNRSECEPNNESQAPAKDSSQFKVENFVGIFYLLIIGLSLAILIAVCEIVYKAKIESKKTKINFPTAVKTKFKLSISGYEGYEDTVADTGCNNATLPEEDLNDFLAVPGTSENFPLKRQEKNDQVEELCENLLHVKQNQTEV